MARREELPLGATDKDEERVSRAPLDPVDALRALLAVKPDESAPSR